MCVPVCVRARVCVCSSFTSISYRITAQGLMDGGDRRDLYVGASGDPQFNGIAVSLGTSGGYNCHSPGRDDPV